MRKTGDEFFLLVNDRDMEIRQEGLLLTVWTDEEVITDFFLYSSLSLFEMIRIADKWVGERQKEKDRDRKRKGRERERGEGEKDQLIKVSTYKRWVIHMYTYMDDSY